MYRICLLLLCLISTRLHAQSPPNVIFILVDDQRYDFLSFHDHPWIETPHIDRLAENSIYFDRAYVTTSLCSPSRASIITGQYAHRHGVADNDTPLPPSSPNFAARLQDQGYHTAFFGKWHMGGSNSMPRAGFDHWVSFKGQGPYFDPDLNINGQIQSFSGYTPEVLTELAISFIDKQKDQGRPYFLYLSHKSVHEDFSPAPQHEGRYQNISIPEAQNAGEDKPAWVHRQRKSWHGAERDFSIQNYGDYQRFFQRYSECMLGVDESVGKLVSKLEALGQLDETVIIYFSDNGYMMGEHGLIDKRVMYEESIRVPSFVHWPQHIKAAKRNSAFILNIDIGPSILDIAGAKIPETMHGRSFLPLLTGESSDWRDAFIYEYFIDPNAVQTPTIFGLRTRTHSYMTYHGVWDRFELYDMQADPAQLNNLLGSVSYGKDYGDFLKFARKQAPKVFPLADSLDQRLDKMLRDVGGSRKPGWHR